MDDKVQELRVAATTEVQGLAWSIRCYVTEGAKVLLKAVGIGAVSQAVKAVTVANKHLAARGVMLAILPTFDVVPDESKTCGEITVVALRLVNVAP